MESLSKQELISTITKQADQIKRYEARLRDVVAAYKGLAKEKEALELSLKALNRTESDEKSSDDSVAALTLSLSTLTAEKSRMEEAFQADKKVTREKYESKLADLRDENRMLVQQHLTEVANLKAKIAYEIQERERERADYAAMMKEFNMKLNEERTTKENLEDKASHNKEAQASQAELEKRVRDLNSSLEASQRRLQRAEARTAQTPALLVRLQNKLALVEQSHSVAIREEQIKAKRAEESARKICAKQEERVALLEEKLAELSQTIGEYDLRRRRDEALIQQLRDSLNGRLMDKMVTSGSTDESQKNETDNDKLADSEYLQTLIDKIHILKKELISENEKLGNPIEISTLFNIEGYENVHSKCHEDYNKLKADFEKFKLENVKEGTGDLEKEIQDLKSEIAVLKEKVDTYRLMLEDEKQDKAESIRIYEEKLKNEQDYYKESVSELKIRIASLEKQAQMQRDRYATLLEETDAYIRARGDRSRKVSSVSQDGHFKDVLADGTAPPHMLHYAHELARKDLDITQLRKDKHGLEGQLRDSQREATIEKERFKEVVRTLKEEIDRSDSEFEAPSVVSAAPKKKSKASTSKRKAGLEKQLDSSPPLELTRTSSDKSARRKRKYSPPHEFNTTRLRRGQSREGANLEYLKNVVLAYLRCTDSPGRTHMLNAIAAVLHFTPREKAAVLESL